MKTAESLAVAAPWCLPLCDRGWVKPCRACPKRPRQSPTWWRGLSVGFIRSGPNDLVSTTNRVLVRRLVDYFKPTGVCLDPCAGLLGNQPFYDALPEPKFWCEIREGRDFLKWRKPVDWIITNPPWSAAVYRPIARHAYEIA